MNTQRKEWPYMAVERNLSQIATEFGTGSGNGIFEGCNFITNNIVSRKKLKGHKVYFELSYGTGFSQDYVYGVTFRDGNGNNYYNQSKCCHSYEEVRETLENFDPTDTE